ncbi:hypothetical protein [Actinoalloteichus caeruleus]|uniref:hypothetical protein n=1 Tax=Actinoalloteichus cyanogriseus TaxID=2893586 RepID=UPI003AABEA8F
MRQPSRIVGVSLAAALVVAGCGGAEEDTESATGNPEPQVSAEQRPGEPEVAETSEERDADDAPAADGEWESIVEDNVVATLVVDGDTVNTTGPLSCPGTLDDSEEDLRIVLECETPDRHRDAGTIEMHPDGDRLVIQWDGEAWGGMIDSFVRIG